MIYNNILELIGNTPLVKINKLNPKTYRLALKKLEISPPETLFVDNKITNLAVALKVEIRVLLIDRENVFRGFNEFPRIKSLDEVLEYL